MISCINSPASKAFVHVYGWGRNDYGQLGFADQECVLTPRLIEKLEGKDPVHISASLWNSAVVTRDGELYTLGTNDSAQLGRSADCNPNHEPYRVMALDIYRVEHAACGHSHMMAITDKALLASWGSSEFGQLGQRGGLGSDQQPPKIVKSVREVPCARVACGAAHSLVLTRSGRLLTCGQGVFGALGDGGEDNEEVPQLLRSLWMAAIVQVSCGENHCAALTFSGEVLTWGRGKYGQLGHGTFDNNNQPREVEGLRGRPCIQVSCGGDHTVGLSVEGAVFSWGRNSWGQLGHGCTDSYCRPALVNRLEGIKVVQVSSGGRHTGVLTVNNEVMMCGAGDQGQLGHEVALDMQLTFTQVGGLPSWPVLYLVAGGDHNFVVFHEVPQGSSAAIGPHPSLPYGRGLLPLTPPCLLEIAEAAAGAPSSQSSSMTRPDDTGAHTRQALLQAMDVLLTSPGFLVGGFTLPPLAPVVPHGLDISAISQTYSSLLRSYDEEVVCHLGALCAKLGDELEKHVKREMRTSKSERSPAPKGQTEQHSSSPSSSALPSPTFAQQCQWARLILILMLNPLLSDPHRPAASMLPHLAATVLMLAKDMQEVLEDWLGTLAPEVIAGRMVRPLQRYLVKMVESGVVTRGTLIELCLFLELIHRANLKTGEKVHYTEFQNAVLSDSLDLRHEYVMWVQGGLQTDTDARVGPISLCQLPFLITPEAKARIVRGEAELRKHNEMQNSAIHALFEGLNPAMVVHLDINVRRSHILQDSINQIIGRTDDLRKPLKVTFFSDGVAEEGVDQGGVSREWFQLLVAEIFKPDYGMFTYQEETRTFWFNRLSPADHAEFQLVGVVLGLAIYNSVILDVHLPLLVYKKLLDIKTSYDDLKEVDPALAHGLDQLLQYPGDDVEEVFCRTFEVQSDFYGEVRKWEVKPGGAAVAVTKDNREEYVRLYTDWWLNQSVKDEFQAFAQGFHLVCGGPALTLFRHEELELLVCGLPHLDFKELEKQARYDGGYHAGHPSIRQFWSVVHSFTLEQKKKFLFFTSGCDRAPVGGLSRLILTIQRSGPDTDRLPTAHTCFYVMLLPEYRTENKMRSKLLLAIENAQGFGLK